MLRSTIGIQAYSVLGYYYYYYGKDFCISFVSDDIWNGKRSEKIIDGQIIR